MYGLYLGKNITMLYSNNYYIVQNKKNPIEFPTNHSLIQIFEIPYTYMPKYSQSNVINLPTTADRTRFIFISFAIRCVVFHY